MRRGDIVLVDFDPARGSEANRRRPAIIVSNDRATSTAQRLGRGVLTVVPLTSNTDRVHPFQVLIPSGLAGLPLASKAQAEQVRTVAMERVDRAPLGALPGPLLAALDDALRLHLDL